MTEMHKRRPGVPKPSSEDARRRMVRQGQRDTAAELEIRCILHKMRFRYRVDYRVLASVRRKVDLAFLGPRIAVFVDGCFWHGCPEHGTWPKANEDFWRDKIETNRRRDADTNRRLKEAGWEVIDVCFQVKYAKSSSHNYYDLKCYFCRKELILVQKLAEQELNDFADQVVANFLRQEMPKLYEQLLREGQINDPSAPCDHRLEKDCQLF